jgi:hypothetical protein
MTEGHQRHRILLETSNPLDLTPEELFELADEIQGAFSEFEVDVGYDDQYGAGVTGHEVLHVFLPNWANIRDGVYVGVVLFLTAWLNKRFKRRHGERRPKSLMLYKEDGTPLGTFVLYDLDAAPTEEEPERVRRKRPKPRTRRKRKS